MAKDFTINNMYLFIHQYNNGGAYDSWVKAADANGDGTLIKSEFEEWIAKELPYWNGIEASDVRGTLNDFWYGLDINRSAKELPNTKLNDLHALSDAEVKRMERIVQEMEVYNELLTDIQGPKNLNDVNRVKWTEEVKAALGDNLDAWINGGANNDYSVLEEYQRIVLEITPAIAIDDMQIDYENLFKYYNYDITTSKDKEVLIGLLDDYLVGKLADITNNYKDEKGNLNIGFGTVDQVETFVEQFMAEAFIDDHSEFVNNVHSTGFVANEFKTGFPGYSELQHNVLATDLYDFAKADEDWAPIIATEGNSNRDDVIEMLKAFTDEQLNGSSKEFKTHLDTILETFKNDDKIQTEGVSYYFDKMSPNDSVPVNKAIKEDLIEELGEEATALVNYYLSNYCNSTREWFEDHIVQDIDLSEDIELDNPAIKTLIVESLANVHNIQQIFENGYNNGVGGYTPTNNVHDGRFHVIKTAMNEATTEDEKAKINQYAINSYEDYCAKLISLGGIYAEAVNYVNDKYEISIDNGTMKVKGDIEGKLYNNRLNQIETFVQEIRNYIDPDGWNVVWNQSRLVGKCGTTQVFDINPKVSTADGPDINNPGLTFKLDSTNLSGVSINSTTGELTIQMPNNASMGSVTVSAVKNGEVVSTNTFAVQAEAGKRVMDDDYGHISEWFDSIHLTDEEGASMGEEYLFAFALHEGFRYTNLESSWTTGMEGSKQEAIQLVTNAVNTFVSELEAVYNVPQLRRAADATISYFTGYINAMQDKKDSFGEKCYNVSFDYIDAKGYKVTGHTEKTKFEYRDGRNNDKLSFDLGEGYVQMWQARADIGYPYKVIVDTQGIVEKLKEFYNSISTMTL